MPLRASAIVLAIAVLGAGAYGLFRAPSEPAGPIDLAPAQEGTAEPQGEEAVDPDGVLPPGHPPIGDSPSVPPGHPPIGGSPSVPPGHPPLGDLAPAHEPDVPTTKETPAIRWSVPKGWQTVANPNGMRIATYRVPGARDGQNAEMSVARAGGTIEANIQRWLGQFDQAGQDTRTEKTIQGLKVTVVAVSGTYVGGGMPGPNTAAHPGWSLCAAIVESPGSSYFFKLLGPTATVRAARSRFDELVASIAPYQ